MKISAKALFSFVFVALAALSSPAAQALDLSGRVGIGASRIGAWPPAFSVDWQVTQATSFEFSGGLDTTNGSNFLLLGIDYARNLFIEDNGAFFLFAGGGLRSQQSGGSNTSGYYFQGGLGARWFFAGLPNLGFNVKTGMSLVSAGGVRITTVVLGGIHYYF